MKRRHFFKSIGALGGLYLTSSVPAFSSVSSFQKVCAGKPKDEKFWKFLRKQFLLPEDYHYLNTGGLGTSPLMVRDTVKKMMAREDMRPTPGHDAEDWWRIKGKCAALLGPGIKKEEVALTSTATEGINIILNGLPLKKGDEIIASTHEHVALVVPLLYKMKTEGIVLKTFKPDFRSGSGNVKRIERLVTKRTRLIFTSHITCTTGQIFPVTEIGRLAKARGVWYALDGAQAAGHLPLNLLETGVDFYAASGHKWLLGPRRTGILYVREPMLETLKPSIVGAYSDKSNDIEKMSLELHPTAQRYEYGTQNDALFYGLETALEFITAIGVKNIRDHNRHLSEMFYDGLKKIPGVEILSPAEEKYRSPIITFKIKEINNEKILSFLRTKNFRMRNVTEANLGGIRVSFHIYNNEEEVRLLLEAIEEVKKLKR
ncbi:MAG: aminotransferase class V-fold PLP-dependent enzyme [bacterium]|nr:aminotransferase class V-fold PLP-dependent enzyme [bacterium]